MFKIYAMPTATRPKSKRVVNADTVQALVLIVPCKFYCHHLRKVKNGQPLYTPYDHGAHRDHHCVFAHGPRPERSAVIGSRFPAASVSDDTSVATVKRTSSSLVPRGQ
ncbi:hypothetical protein V5799_012480 [Amblyomma americanum]|uniref:Uncharacterized protein n=1 Tax=Amblyomma americanum TaxID=6943 RepID=A0AAQ4EEA3_AMBAM